LNHPHDRVADSGECSGLQLSGLSGNEAGVNGEKLARARVTATRSEPRTKSAASKGTARLSP